MVRDPERQVENQAELEINTRLIPTLLLDTDPESEGFYSPKTFSLKRIKNKAFLILLLCLQCYNTCLLSPRSLHWNSLENIFMSPIKHPSYLSRVSYFVSGDIRNNKYEVCQPAHSLHTRLRPWVCLCQINPL